MFILSTLPPIAKCRREIGRARADGRDADEREWIRRAENDWGARVLSRFDVRVERTNESEAAIPEDGALFVSNHDGYGDIPAFMAAIPERQLGFIAKDELSKLPIFSKWIVRIRSIMLLREDPREALRVFAEGEDFLRRGFSLVIFPEGTRAKGDDMKAFAKGSLRMALRTGAKIVPVATRGSWACFEGAGYPTAGVIRFHVFDPIETVGIAKGDEAALSARIEQMIRAKIEAWKAEEQQERA